MDDAATHRLVQQAINGDRDALRVVWEAHRRWVAAVLLAHGPREAEVDDLLQDVAVSVVSRIGGLRDPASFKPWLRAVALNAAHTAGRRRPSRAVRALARLGLVRDEASHTPPDDASESTDDGAKLMALASRLAEGYREPLLLRCVQGMSYREIGQVMGLPETTIETRIARGRRMLRELADADKLAQEKGAARAHEVRHE
jgi:RNA polymerase sigma-70 factor, ECF subfamily